MIIGNWKWYTRIKKSHTCISSWWFWRSFLVPGIDWNSLILLFAWPHSILHWTVNKPFTFCIAVAVVIRPVSTGRCCIASMHSQSPVHVLAFLGENQSSRPLHPGCINYRPARISLQSAVRQVNIKPNRLWYYIDRKAVVIVVMIEIYY